jgi:hypothetical protein
VSDCILAKLIRAGDETLLSKIYIINTFDSVWNVEELPDKRRESVVIIYRKGDNTD